jgi:hypothetical protein
MGTYCGTALQVYAAQRSLVLLGAAGKPRSWADLLEASRTSFAKLFSVKQI